MRPFDWDIHFYEQSEYTQKYLPHVRRRRRRLSSRFKLGYGLALTH